MLRFTNLALALETDHYPAHMIDILEDHGKTLVGRRIGNANGSVGYYKSNLVHRTITL
jgi:hypothetical protein